MRRKLLKAVLRYGITDLRALYEGDVRFLSQFRDD